MSGGVCAVMLVKDEADVIETTIRHLLWHVDGVLVADNMSTDGTRDILERLSAETQNRVAISDDPEIGYYQDRKTTALAMEALRAGFRWVLPCDADEIWQHNDPAVSIRDHLAGVGPDVGIFRAPVFNHLATDADNTDGGDDTTFSFEPNPVKRIRWRQKKSLMFKVICRLRPDLQIEMGNHGAQVNGRTLTLDGPFNVRHFSWRSEDQFLRKIKNGRAAYAATSLPPTYGVGWRMYDGDSDEAIRASFQNAFFIRNPDTDITLIYDPAPLKGQPPEGGSTWGRSGLRTRPSQRHRPLPCRRTSRPAPRRRRARAKIRPGIRATPTAQPGAAEWTRPRPSSPEHLRPSRRTCRSMTGAASSRTGGASRPTRSRAPARAATTSPRS